jgi:hypothetical protein
VIVNRYSRNPSNVPDFHALSQGAGESDVPAAKTASGLNSDDVDAIGKLAQAKGLLYSEARDMYCRDKKTVA